MIFNGQLNIMEKRAQKLMFWYAFLMAFPAVLIIQNISVFLFPFLLLTMHSLSGRFFILKYRIQFIAIAFGFGAIISVWNIPETMPYNSLSSALSVLPNYLYWVVLIMLLASQKEWIRLDVIFRGIFLGTLLSLVYFFVLQDFLLVIPIFKQITPNTFSFLLICYTPIVVWYAWYRYGFLVACGILLALVLSGFLSGSRSGSLLTLSGGLFTFLLNRKSVGKIFTFSVLGFIVILFIGNSEIGKGLVFDLNERTYDLIYNRKETLEGDRSYLVRLAQIEKAVIIFNKYPVSGIGLNNFTTYKVKLLGDFEGAEYVINKKRIDEKSAHNSYFGFLAEGGLVLVVPFVVLLLYIIGWFFFNANRVLPKYRPVFIGIIHMSIHLYFIYAILNVFAWFLIALGGWVIVKHKT